MLAGLRLCTFKSFDDENDAMEFINIHSIDTPLLSMAVPKLTFSVIFCSSSSSPLKSLITNKMFDFCLKMLICILTNPYAKHTICIAHRIQYSRNHSILCCESQAMFGLLLLYQISCIYVVTLLCTLTVSVPFLLARNKCRASICDSHEQINQQKWKKKKHWSNQILQWQYVAHTLTRNTSVLWCEYVCCKKNKFVHGGL